MTLRPTEKETQMAFWSSETLKGRGEGLISPYDPERVMHGAYELSVGSEAFVTSNPSNKTRVGHGEKIVIPPGQFGLLVTKETITIPNNAIAFISMKATTKFKGLVNVSGFHVDPGYKNTLKFAVYNAGSQRIVLDQGQALFLIWFADLDQPTADLYVPRPGSGSGITADDVSKIQGEVASPGELKKQLEDLKNEIEKKFHATERDIIHNNWKIAILTGLIISTIAFAVIRPLFDSGGSKKDANPPSQGSGTGAPVTKP